MSYSRSLLVRLAVWVDFSSRKESSIDTMFVSDMNNESSTELVLLVSIWSFPTREVWLFQGYQCLLGWTNNQSQHYNGGRTVDKVWPTQGKNCCQWRLMKPNNDNGERQTAIRNKANGFIHLRLAESSLSSNDGLFNGVGPFLIRHDEQKLCVIQQ